MDPRKFSRLMGAIALGIFALIQLQAGNTLFGLLLFATACVLGWGSRSTAEFAAAKNTKDPSEPKKQFDASMAHDNIALDVGRDMLWIRDPKLGERFVQRSELLSWRTNFDTNNNRYLYRIELQLRDVNNPVWNVLFRRHSQTWIKTQRKNEEERDEWFARLQAWNRSPPATKAATTPLRDFRVSLHESYYGSDNDEHRATYLAAFDMGCNAEGFDQKASWERLGGEYPGPSPELLEYRGEQAQNR